MINLYKCIKLIKKCIVHIVNWFVRDLEQLSHLFKEDVPGSYNACMPLPQYIHVHLLVGFLSIHKPSASNIDVILTKKKVHFKIIRPQQQHHLEKRYCSDMFNTQPTKPPPPPSFLHISTTSSESDIVCIFLNFQ